LERGGCTYYKKHRYDEHAADAFHGDEGCPLAHKKCSFYEVLSLYFYLKCQYLFGFLCGIQDVKAGKKGSFDVDGHDCPLAEKCPYYSQFKQSPEKAGECPLGKSKCPRTSIYVRC
jgi:hypothetical protein